MVPSSPHECRAPSDRVLLREVRAPRWGLPGGPTAVRGDCGAAALWAWTSRLALGAQHTLHTPLRSRDM